MDHLQESGASIHRRRRSRRAAITLTLVAILLLFASAGNPVYSVANVTALMDISDASNRGTIMSSRFAITQLALIVGTATGALISKLVGPAATYGVLGAGLVGLGLVAAVLSRERTQIVPATE